MLKRGNQFEEENDMKKLYRYGKEGLNLIPEPQQYYSETMVFFIALLEFL